MASISPARVFSASQTHDDIIEIKAFISGVQEMAIFACVSFLHACLPFLVQARCFSFTPLAKTRIKIMLNVYGKLETQWHDKVLTTEKIM